MALQQHKVAEIVDMAVSRKLDIPEFQREFIWGPDQVKLLAESLYRNYPVGSFLVWDSFQYREAKTTDGTTESLWIVDGQQRTTALCLLLGLKPYWWPDSQDWNESLARHDVLVNVLPETGEGRLEFALPNPIRRQDPRWFPVRRVLGCTRPEQLTLLAQEIVKAQNTPTDDSTFTRVHAHLHGLWQIRDRDIPVVRIAHEVEDVAEIFARLNREGTRVKEADVVLALAAVRNPGWVRQEYIPYKTDLEERGWDLDPGLFIRTMTGLELGRGRLSEVPASFWDPNELSPAWRRATENITDVLRKLANFGIVCGSLLPSMNSLIPLFVVHGHCRESRDYSFDQALWWFLMANRDGRYSASPVTSLHEDLGAIYRSSSFREAVEQLTRRVQVGRIEGAEFLERYDRAGSRFLRLMLWLVLFHNEASDWVDGTRLGYDKTGSAMTSGFEPQWHHIYPKSLLRKIGQADDTIHALANMTVCNEGTNATRLLSKAPWQYIQQYGISAEALLSHCVPSSFAAAAGDEPRLKQQWEFSRYEHFLTERAALLAEAANRLLDRLRSTRKM